MNMNMKYKESGCIGKEGFKPRFILDDEPLLILDPTDI